MKPFQRLLVAAPAAALLPVVMAPAGSLANDVQLNLESVQEYSIAQSATIRDFSDVYPTDWAYQALAKLIDTYGCVSGFPDGTFRGNQPMTRFEMAAVLNSCLDSISAKMDMMDEEMKMKSMEDMDTMERLMASFEEELITLKGSMDGLDAKVSELEDNQFSTTTKASFKIATDFTYFASDDRLARSEDFANIVAAFEAVDSTSPSEFAEAMAGSEKGEDNSGLAMSSSAEIKFKTSFTGSDALTFKLKGDVMGSGGNYLVMGNFYDVADGDTKVEFTGFTYETNLDLGGMSANLILGTDYADFDGLVGLDTYYGGGGYDGYGSGSFKDAVRFADVSVAALVGAAKANVGVSEQTRMIIESARTAFTALGTPSFGNFGDTGIGFNVDLLSSDAGTLTASASYAVAADDASDQTGKKGVFGEDTDYSGALALSWNGALFGGNEAMFTMMYRYVDHNNLGEMIYGFDDQGKSLSKNLDLSQNDWKFVAGAYLTDTLSLSGSYAFSTVSNNIPGIGNDEFAQWMIAVNLEDAIFPGNSAGLAYGTTAFFTDTDAMPGYEVPTVLEFYYSFNINDNFEVPIYLDFISNAAGVSDSDAFAFAVRPTLTF